MCQTSHLWWSKPFFKEHANSDDGTGNFTVNFYQSGTIMKRQSLKRLKFQHCCGTRISSSTSETFRSGHVPQSMGRLPVHMAMGGYLKSRIAIGY